MESPLLAVVSCSQKRPHEGLTPASGVDVGPRMRQRWVRELSLAVSSSSLSLLRLCACLAYMHTALRRRPSDSSHGMSVHAGPGAGTPHAQHGPGAQRFLHRCLSNE